MTKQLTLSLNEETVKRAERISESRGKTISLLVEELLNSIPENGQAEETAVDRIKKILKGKITNPSVEWKEAKTEHLIEKHGL